MSLADCLFSQPVQNILRTVYAVPTSDFMLTNLIEQAGTGRGNGQRYVAQLLNAGILKEGPRRGRQRTIGANTTFPLYPELLKICQKSFGLIEPLYQALLPFKADIDEAFVFGSVAKGNDTHRSDIDVMVVGSPPLLEVSEAVLKTEGVLGRPIHLNVYTAEEWADLRVSDPVISRISAETIMRIFPHETTA